MIRSNETEHVRVTLPTQRRSAEEIGRLLVDALDRAAAISLEKRQILDNFSILEAAVRKEIADLVKEQKGQPDERHEDVACEVWYDMDARERLLLGRENICCKDVDVPRASIDSTDVRQILGRRTMTDAEWADGFGLVAQRLASEDAKS